MNKIFNKKPWVEPLSVAGTSVDESSMSDNSTDEINKQSSKYI